MALPEYQDVAQSTEHTARKRSRPKLTWHTILFFATFLFTLMAGTAWAGKDYADPSLWYYGLTYSLLILTFISAHEFGHYFAARYHGVDTTLPYYIPWPFIFPFGTMGAVIRIRSTVPDRKALFDIGVAGPIAGFIISVAILIFGYATLPGIEFLYDIHPEYRAFGGQIPMFGMHFGDTLLYSWLGDLFASSSAFIPPMNEMYHYPYLCVGWFGLFVTSLNLLPIGQLDGGHILYAMFGKTQHRIGRIVWWSMILFGLCGVMGIVHTWLETAIFLSASGESIDSMFMWLLPFLRFLDETVPWLLQAWPAWLFWAFITRVFIRIEHPPILDHSPLDSNRMAIGWFAMIMLVVCFAYKGIYELNELDSGIISPEPRNGSIVVINTPPGI